MPPRASKPRNQLGQYLSKEDAALRANEIAERKADAIAAKVPKRPTPDRFKDDALKVRKTQTRGRRDSGARELAKATGRTVTHRTFRSEAKAKAYLDDLKGKKSKLAWWKVSARNAEGVLFDFINPVGTVDRAANELDMAKNQAMPDAIKKPTDFKVKESVRSSDTRITVYVLNLNPPKQKASNANKNQTAVGTRKRSEKSKGSRRDGSGPTNQQRGNGAGSVAGVGSSKRGRATGKGAAKSGNPRPGKRLRVTVGRAKKARSGKARKR